MAIARSGRPALPEQEELTRVQPSLDELVAAEAPTPQPQRRRRSS